MYYGTGWKSYKHRLEHERKRKERKNFPYRRFQRASAQLQLCTTGEVVDGRVFLHDLTLSGVGIFLSRPLNRDEQVFLVLEQPKHLFVRGRIEWCGIYRLHSAVISAENFQYRAAIRFQFESDEERRLVARYFEDLAVR